MKHLIVTGGNGFLGREICSIASNHGIPVVSIARSGKPVNINDSDYQTVKWISADIFKAGEWKQYLDNCMALIHCIGIIEEQPAKGITYERMIFGSAKIAAITAKANGVNKFVYISAGAAAPETPAAYMEQKTAAEDFLSSSELALDLTILKPGMMFGEARPETIKENEHIQQLMLDPVIGPQIKSNRPLPVETVAQVAIHAATHYSPVRKLYVDDIERMFETLRC